MDPQGTTMNDDGVYNFSEIWQVFQEGAASSTPAGYGVEPMESEQQRLNHIHNQYGIEKSRKRRDGVDSAKAGVSINNSGPSNSDNAMSEGDAKRPKPLETSHETSNNEVQPSEPPKQDYIHVRARRGQATDSHSLAERARREKISERMRILQDLVPGCNKVIGKALVLDEIINYIQSLQRQVEFLSMKLEAVNARVTLGGYPLKDHFSQQTFDASNIAFSPQNSRGYGRGSSTEWLHMHIGGGCE